MPGYQSGSRMFSWGFGLVCRIMSSISLAGDSSHASFDVASLPQYRIEYLYRASEQRRLMGQKGRQGQIYNYLSQTAGISLTIYQSKPRCCVEKPSESIHELPRLVRAEVYCIAYPASEILALTRQRHKRGRETEGSPSSQMALLRLHRFLLWPGNSASNKPCRLLSSHCLTKDRNTRYASGERRGVAFEPSLVISSKEIHSWLHPSGEFVGASARIVT
ncbi:hypothetical protein GQ53DRAFT_88499 [Thozetella sp. PMI_491]|nr:hypothetical protein GQ53DRAFT_88499 [Thozetella sp. PMI_491]